jgi:hypothetical protein
MSSFACLLIELPPAWTQKLDAIHGQLEKIVEVYLEARWSWPRRFSRASSLIFLLADPRVARLDAGELCKLSDELQHHLFGNADEGEVSLLLFEGPEPAVLAFAAFSADEVAAAVADPGLLPAGGRLTRIRPGANPVVEGLGPGLDPEAHHAAAAAQAIHPSHRYKVGLLGTYLLSREVFIADVLTVAPLDAPHHYSVIEDAAALPPDEAVFDEICFRAVGEVLAHKAGGLPLGVPVAYSNFARPAQARRFRDMLALLPRGRRDQLNASVYGAPRHLPSGVSAIWPVLAPWFGTLNLITADPGFEIEQIASHSVGCVVFSVRDHEPAARHAAMRAFAGHHHAYAARGIRQVLANLRTPAELDLAAKLDLQIVSGPAVSGVLETPIGGRAVPLRRLPAVAEAAARPSPAAAAR